MPSQEFHAFLVSSSAQLASSEAGTGGASKLIKLELVRLKKIKAKRVAKAQRLEANLAEAERSKGNELQYKSDLADQARRKAAANQVAEGEERNQLVARDVYKAAAKNYNTQWVKLKETSAELHQLDAKNTHCARRLNKAQKAKATLLEAKYKVSKKLETLKERRKNPDQKNPDAIKSIIGIIGLARKERKAA